MTYNSKEDIINLRFKRKRGRGLSEYIIKCTWGTNVEFKHISSGYCSVEQIDDVLRKFNNGTWVVTGIGKEALIEQTYQIY